MSELEHIKAGDEVVLRSGKGLKTTIAKVERTTATQIIVSGIKFRRDGRQVGGDSWSRGSISAVTPERLEQIESESRIRSAVYREGIKLEFQFRQLDNGVQSEILAILTKHAEGKQK